MAYQKEYKALEQLLANMDQIQAQLQPWIHDTNLFNILQVTRREIRHSNFLGFLMNPQASHKLNERFLKDFLSCFYRMNTELIQANSQLTIFDILLGDFDDVIVFREWKNIDLVLISEKNNLVIAVENKIDAGESLHQLTKYREIVEGHYQSYQHLLIFLTPDGTQPTKEEWGIITYQEVAAILNDILKTENLEPRIQLLIEDYEKTIRRDIIVDKELEKICHKIYMQYQDAFDLIFEAKPDNLSLMRDIYFEVLIDLSNEGKVIFDPTHSGKSLIHFQIPALNQVFPNFNHQYESKWKGSDASYFVEIINKDRVGRYKIVLNSASSNEVRQTLNDKMDKFGQKNNKTNWEWWTIHSSHIKNISRDLPDQLLNLLYDSERENIKDTIKIARENEINKMVDKFKIV